MMPFPTELPGNAVVAFRQDCSSPSPLSQLGRGAGGEGPKSQPRTKPLTGLIARALSPGERGNCSSPCLLGFSYNHPDFLSFRYRNPQPRSVTETTPK